MPHCVVLAAAMSKKGFTHAQLATKAGITEQRVIALCTGASTPSESEFKALVSALGIKDVVPQAGVHSTV